MHTDALLNDFAVRCFRDVADCDYIAARMAYRAGLFSQFYWSGLQAIEKYLKAILLFNRIVARDVKHDLDRALRYARKLPFQLDMSASSEKLIEQLDRFGRYRYLESSYFIHGPKLVELDRAVWEVRRYCTVLDYECTVSDGTTRKMLDVELDRIRRSAQEPPHKFQLLGGRLVS